MVVVEWFQRTKQHALQFGEGKMFRYRIVRWGVYYALLLMMLFCSGTNQTFIYFQF